MDAPQPLTPATAAWLVPLQRLLAPWFSRTWVRLLTALAAGALVPLALAPFYWWWCGPLSAMVLYCLLQGLTPKQAFFTGWAYGYGLQAAGIHWIYVSIHVFGNASPPLAAALMVVFIFYMGLYSALQWWVYQRFCSLPGLAGGWVFAALWTLGEWFRAWFLTGFPWLFLGYSHTDTVLAEWAPVGGVYLISFLVILSTLSLFIALLKPASKAHWLAPAPLLVTLFGALALVPVAWVQPVGEPIRTLLVQGNIPLEEKWQADKLDESINTYRRLTPSDQPFDLVIWPETAIPYYLNQASGLVRNLGRQAANQGYTLISGIPAWTEREDGSRKLHNSIISADSEVIVYHKQKLVPFGEFVPFESVLRGAIEFFDLPMSSFSPGPLQQPVLQGAGARIAPYICFEIVYPDLVAYTSRQADLLVTISNDAWFGRSIGPHQHFQMARMRAQETGRYLLRATNNGITAIVDSEGRTLADIPQFQQAVLQGEAYRTEGLTPYNRTGSWPILGFCGLIAGLAAWHRRRISLK